MNKISTFFDELQTNISDLFSHVQTGISNFASLMYQSIDNLRTNAINKLQLFGQQIQDKINEFIFKPVNEKVIQPIKNAFEAIGNFFNGLVEAIISPFRSFFEKISNICIDQKIMDRISIGTGGVGPWEIHVCPFADFINVFNSIKEAIKNAFATILSPITTAFDSVKNALTQFKDLVSNGITKVQDFFWKIIEKIKEDINKTFERITTFFNTLGEKITGAYENVYNEVSQKIKDLRESITAFFKDIWTNINNAIETMLTPIRDAFSALWEKFQDAFKNFIAELNGVYLEVQKQWKIVYEYIRKRIFHVAYISWINLIDSIIPFSISKTMKINIVHGLLFMACVGWVIYYYNMITGVIVGAANGALTVLGDLYGVLGSVFPLIEMATDIVYTILGKLPTLTFAMDTFAFLSPARIIPNVLQQLIDLADLIIGGARDIVLTPTFIFIFICALIVSIVVGIHTHMKSKMLKVDKVDKLADKITIPKTENILTKPLIYKDINRNINKALVPKPILFPKETKMDELMKEFKDRMDKFKRKVDLIEEVRKKYEYNPNDPNKVLETNLNSMILELKNKISQAGLTGLPVL
jgi:methyl-accepting chemotaxis protein